MITEATTQYRTMLRTQISTYDSDILATERLIAEVTRELARLTDLRADYVRLRGLADASLQESFLK